MKLRTAIAAGSIVLASAGIAPVVASVTAGAPASASVTHPHKLPAWMHWAYASKSARADCHGGPAVIVWIDESDQSYVFCQNGDVLLPS